jgi:xylulokinase
MILAFDLGGSSLRAALVDMRGDIRHVVSAPHSSAHRTEADPAAWWDALIQAAERLAVEADFARVEAVAIAAFTRTQVLIDADGKALCPAPLWHDTRAEPVLSRLRALLPPDHPELPTVNVFHPMSRLFHMACQPGGLPDALAFVVEPKDYLNARLTGRVAVDSLASTRLIAAAQTGPAGSLLAACGLPPNIVPPALAPTDVLAPVQPGLPGALAMLAGVPVLVMAHDSWASVIGLGALRPGYGYNLSGTTEVLGMISPHPAQAEGLLTLAWGNGLQQIGGPSTTGADSLAWLLDLLAQPQASAAISPVLNDWLDQPRHPQPLLFLPYLQGERTPYWDPSLRGAFIGLHRRHGPGDLAWSVMEGVAFLNRIVLERAEAAVGQTVHEIRFGGGGAGNARWCQIKADVMRRDIVVVEQTESGLLGAAVVAFTALGRFADLAEAQTEMVRTRAVFRPQPEQAAFYDRLWPQYRAAEAALAPISHQLAAMEVA